MIKKSKKRPAGNHSLPDRSRVQRAGRETKGSQQKIAELFRNLRFRRCLIGGVDEADVWRQLETIQKEYEKILEIQTEKLRALIKERDEEITRLKGVKPVNPARRSENPASRSENPAGRGENSTGRGEFDA